MCFLIYCAPQSRKSSYSKEIGMRKAKRGKKITTRLRIKFHAYRVRLRTPCANGGSFLRFEEKLLPVLVTLFLQHQVERFLSQIEKI